MLLFASHSEIPSHCWNQLRHNVIDNISKANLAKQVCKNYIRSPEWWIFLKKISWFLSQSFSLMSGFLDFRMLLGHIFQLFFTTTRARNLHTHTPHSHRITCLWKLVLKKKSWTITLPTIHTPVFLLYNPYLPKIGLIDFCLPLQNVCKLFRFHLIGMV